MGDFSSSSIHRVKEYAERLQHRMRNMRAVAEKSIGHAMAVAEVNGASFGWGYMNERYGTVTDATTGLKEIEVLGVPADVGIGGALLAVSFFGGLGRYDEHGINIGNGSTSPFAYRMGAAMGRNALAKANGTTSTQGRMGTGAGGSRVWDVRHRSNVTR